MSQVHHYLRTLSEGNREQGSSSRPLSTYYIHGVEICQVFSHGISHNRYLRIVELYTTHGLTVSEHGRLPSTFEQMETVQTFTENYACAHSLPVPGCTKNKLLLLPSDVEDVCVPEV